MKPYVSMKMALSVSQTDSFPHKLCDVLLFMTLKIDDGIYSEEHGTSGEDSVCFASL